MIGSKLARVGGVITAAIVLSACQVQAPVPADGPSGPLVVLAVGDSITDADGHVGWPARLAGHVGERAGQQLTVHTYAVGGWGTSDLLPGLGATLVALDPDLVLISIGTNDTGDISAFEARYRQILRVVHDISDARIGWSWLQYSAPSWLAAGEAAVNDAIYRTHASAGGFAVGGRWAGFADLQQIPPSYLDGGGVHPTDAGYEAYAEIWYSALRGTYGWPPVAWAPNPPMTGHRP